MQKFTLFHDSHELKLYDPDTLILNIKEAKMFQENGNLGLQSLLETRTLYQVFNHLF